MKRLAMILVTVAMVLAACGGSSSAPAASTSSGPSKVAAIAAEVPSSVPTPIQIATDATYPPDESIDPTTGDIVGWDIDLGKAICKVMGVVCTFNNVSFDNIIPQLTASNPRYLLSLSSFTPTSDREAKGIDFVSYYKAGEGWVVAASSTITVSSPADMCGHTIAVETGTTEEGDAWAYIGKQIGGAPLAGGKDNCTAAGKQDLKVSNFEKQTDANTALLSGRADIGFLDSQVAAYQVKQTSRKVKTTGQGCSVAPYGIAIPKGSPLEKPIMDAVKYLIENGYYATILQNWSVLDGAIQTSAVKINDNTSIGPTCVP
ncbi:MAG TPA: ABC transporter substrate-binding protein [Candidatus Dormibacteraeota bacterium]|nr:ABC transporter substrate-binding protein [Candidatus Dormibacteraeota bacterium]